MRAVRIRGVALLGMLAAAFPAWAEVDSGPALGTKVPPLSVRIVAEGKPAEPADIVTARRDEPTVYVFVQGEVFDRPAARYLRGVDEAVRQVQKSHPLASLVIVWLPEDLEAGARRVGQVQQSLKLNSATWSQYRDEKNPSPEGWPLHQRAAITTVLAVNGTVAGRFGYDVPNEMFVKDLDAALDAAKVK